MSGGQGVASSNLASPTVFELVGGQIRDDEGSRDWSCEGVVWADEVRGSVRGSVHRVGRDRPHKMAIGVRSDADRRVTGQHHFDTIARSAPPAIMSDTQLCRNP